MLQTIREAVRSAAIKRKVERPDVSLGIKLTVTFSPPLQPSPTAREKAQIYALENYGSTRHGRGGRESETTRVRLKVGGIRVIFCHVKNGDSPIYT